MHNRNPLPQVTGRRTSGSGYIRSAQRTYRAKAISAGSKLQRDIWKWMRSYGMSINGHTFMDQNTYVKQIFLKFKDDDLDRWPESNVRISEVESLLEDYALNAPLLILTSSSSYDDLFSILTETTNSSFYEKMLNNQFKGDKDADEKLGIIARKLYREFNKLINKAGWVLGTQGPEELHVKLRAYPHDNYDVFPLYLKGNKRKGQLRTLIPFRR
jgi:hypothetical protein